MVFKAVIAALFVSTTHGVPLSQAPEDHKHSHEHSTLQSSKIENGAVAALGSGETCGKCKMMMEDAKTKFKAESCRSKPDASCLHIFQTDLIDVILKECSEALGDQAECKSCKQCVLSADVTRMNTFLDADDEALCRDFTGGKVCPVAEDAYKAEQALYRYYNKTVVPVVKHKHDSIEEHFLKSKKKEAKNHAALKKAAAHI